MKSRARTDEVSNERKESAMTSGRAVLCVCFADVDADDDADAEPTQKRKIKKTWSRMKYSEITVHNAALAYGTLFHSASRRFDR